MKEIYNEGRIVGLSQYELYIRQLLSDNPEATPMTEREWLASTVSESSSMILKVAAGTTRGYHDYALPVGCELCGCTMLHAYMFEGEVAIDGSDGYWATGVDSYGNLVSNTGTSHPSTPGTPSHVPTMPNPETITPRIKQRCKDYLKISSGILMQPGEWTAGAYYTPLLNESNENMLVESGDQLLVPINTASTYQTLKPNLGASGFIRIAVTEDIVGDVYIFFHGFVYKPWIRSAVSGLDGGLFSRPQDGDFLGPTLFPWGCPIMFTVTTNIIETINNGIVISLVD